MFNTDGRISSYPKVYNFGHPGLGALVRTPDTVVTVEEKLDGSQISFGINPVSGEVVIRSKGADINPADPPKLFGLAVEGIKTAAYAGRLRTGYVYRGEAICSRRHNSLQYDRFPETGVVLYDIEAWDDVTQAYTLLRTNRASMAAEAGFEFTPVHLVATLQEVFGSDMNAALEKLLEIPPMLGGAYSEGVVIKAHDLFGVDGKFLAGKFVRPEFRELNDKTWKSAPRGDGTGWERNFAAAVMTQVNRVARWQKALQHLRDTGALTGEPRDIPVLMQYVSTDGQEELTPVIEAMAKKAWKSVSKGLTAGLAEWYKQKLVDEQAAEYAGRTAFDTSVADDHITLETQP